MAKKKIKTFEQIPVWMKSHQLALIVYKITNRFPQNEIYGLTNQLRRAAYSIPSNIAEGFCRNSTKELINFLYISRGSCGECIYFIFLSKDLKYISLKDYKYLRKELTSISKQLNGWIKSLKARLSK